MAVTYNLKGTTNPSFKIGKSGSGTVLAEALQATSGSQLLLSGTTLTWAGDVAFDTNTLFVDATNNRVGIGTTSPGTALDVSGILNVSQFIVSSTYMATTEFKPNVNDGAVLGTSASGFSDIYLADGAVIYFGNDQDTTITHTPDTGITLNNNLTVGGDLTIQGTTTTVDSTTIAVTNSFTFEGTTADDFETVLTVTDPTADRTVTIPDATGTIVLRDSTDTLINKSIDVDNNTVTNIEVDNLKSGVLDTDISSVAGTDTTLASAKAIKTYVDAQVPDDTDGLAEGSSNLYYTDARVQAVSINNLVEDTTPQLGGTLDANGNDIDMGTNTITDTKVGQWDTAYGWGDHSTQSYLSGSVGFPTDMGSITGSTSTFPVGTAPDFGALTGDTFVGLGLEDLGVIRQEVTATSTDTLSNKTLSAPSVTGAIELAVTSDPTIVTDKAHVYAKDADADAVTNLITHSEQFDNSAWVDATLSALSTMTANDGTDPLGGSTADRISGGTGGSMRAQQTGVSYTNGTTYTFSVYVKGTSGQTVGVGRYNPTQDGDVTVTTHTLDGTWQRLSHTFTATATNSGGRVVISGNGDKSQTATDFLVWGAQLEAGVSSPGVYVQTTTTSATGYEQRAEVYVKDESGNVTKISPHNQQGEWEYYSRNVITGKVVRINMEEMIRDIESLTGKSYIKQE